MLRPRLIVSLLVHNGGLTKTVNFSDYKYVGDPINAVRIFNEKEVDELVVSDIDATVNDVEPNYRLIESLAVESRMPLCYSGGVKSSEQLERIISLGVEKVALGNVAVRNPKVIEESCLRVGSQSVVVVMDVKMVGEKREYELFTHSGTKRTGVNPFHFAKQAEDMGAGEILLNSIDRDGTMQGYDHCLIDQVYKTITVPLSVLGGAGSLDDIRSLIVRHGVIGAAAGSIFVFKGRYRAVLINYPARSVKDAMCITESIA